MSRLHHRVLLIDDDRSAIEQAQHWFEAGGHECRVVSSVDAAIECGSGFAPDVALVDLSLLDPGGLQLGRALRRRLGAGIYIAVMTSWARADTAFRVFSSGCDYYLRKPLSLHRLRFMLWDAEQPKKPIVTATIR